MFTDNEPAFADLGGQLHSIGQTGAWIDAAATAAPLSARRELLAWLSQDPGTVIYVGHGSMRMLGDEKYLVTEDDEWGPAVVVAWSCLSAGFAHPTYDSLAEVWLKARAGAVAFVGPTGETTTAEQAAMAQVLQRELVQGQSIGAALLHAWRIGQSRTRCTASYSWEIRHCAR